MGRRRTYAAFGQDQPVHVGRLRLEGLLELIERIRKRIAQELGPSVEMISCYEAGYDGFWLHRLLEGHGVRNHVIDPASLQVDRRARRAKTDRIDAARLLRSLMAHALRVHRLVVVDAVDGAKALDAVDVLATFVDEAVTLTVQSTVILFGNAWHTHHAPHFWFPTHMRHQRAQ